MNSLVDFDKIFQGSKYMFDVFEKYFDYQDKFLSVEIDKLNQELDEKIKNKDYEEQVYWMDLYNEFYLNFLSGTFPDIQNKTSLVILFSVFESTLKKLCKSIGSELNTPLEYSELAGDDLAKCKKFLIKLCGINKETFESDCWRKIDCVRKIRNSLVHNDSDISSILEKNKYLIDDFKKCDGFNVIDGHLVLTKNEFLKQFIVIIVAFYSELETQLKNGKKLKMN